MPGDPELPIACVEGWSASGPGAAYGSRTCSISSMLPGDADAGPPRCRRVGVPHRVSLALRPDPRTLLALELNGDALDLDHGFPCRLIAPNRPGVLQTKWVARIEVVR